MVVALILIIVLIVKYSQAPNKDDPRYSEYNLVTRNLRIAIFVILLIEVILHFILLYGIQKIKNIFKLKK
jgi:Ca2+/Na+ antiporter